MKCCKKFVWSMMLGVLLGAFSIADTPVLAASEVTTNVVSSTVRPVPAFSAEAAVLIEAETGRILVAHNENKRLHPASTTKMVTLLTALKNKELDLMNWPRLVLMLCLWKNLI